MLQGLALGGEYGGAATYVAEHAPDDKRGYYTSWIQTTATLGLFLSLVVILIVQGSMSKDAFAAWGWRIPFLLSFILLGISVWIRLSLSESPTFQRMKERARAPRRRSPRHSASGRTPRSRSSRCSALLRGQAVVWYSGQFYALFFLQNVLKVDAQSVNIMIAIALALGSIFFVVFGWLSDKVGRKPIIMVGLAAGDRHLLPAVQGPDLGGKSGARQRPAERSCHRHGGIWGLQVPVQSGWARRSSRRPAMSRPRS